MRQPYQLLMYLVTKRQDQTGNNTLPCGECIRYIKTTFRRKVVIGNTVGDTVGDTIERSEMVV